MTKLRATWGQGTLVLLSHGALLIGAFALSLRSETLLWILGQVLMALAMLQAFVILHECGHGVFFPKAWANHLLGGYAGWLCVIPYPAWQHIHQKHHIWTGWQDKDPTTSQVVPRPLRTSERVVLNFCWRTGLPLFSVLYRLNNYWNIPRLRQFFSGSRQWRRFLLILSIMISGYFLLCSILGMALAVKLFALANFLHLVMCDPILLSQHSHIPQHLSHGTTVQPFPVSAQGAFTRSLRFPRWFSRWILLNFDAHEKHHAFPRVPGYLLHKVEMQTINEVDWWEWIRQAKRVPAATLLFKNRHETNWHF